MIKKILLFILNILTFGFYSYWKLKNTNIKSNDETVFDAAKQRTIDEKNLENIDLKKLQKATELINKAINNEVSNIDLGNNFEDEIYKNLKTKFPNDQILKNAKSHSNSDISHKIKVDNQEGLILYEIKSGDFQYKPFVDKLKEDIKKHSNVIFGIFITAKLPKTQMLDSNKKILLVEDTNIMIVSQDIYEAIIPVIRSWTIDILKSRNFKLNSSLSENEKEIINLLSSTTIRQSLIDFENKIRLFTEDIKKEKDDILKIINTRHEKQLSYLRGILEESTDIKKILEKKK